MIFDVSGGPDKDYTRRNETCLLDNAGWVVVSHMIYPRYIHALSTITFHQELKEAWAQQLQAPSSVLPLGMPRPVEDGMAHSRNSHRV